jgi:hypothetical protein
MFDYLLGGSPRPWVTLPELIQFSSDIYVRECRHAAKKETSIKNVLKGLFHEKREENCPKTMKC